MAIAAGKLRRRITIEQRLLTQDPGTGEMLHSWQVFANNVPAAIEPLSAREFIAAQAGQSEVTARIVIRYREGVLPTMRILHKNKVYNIRGILADANSGMEYLTLPVSEGVNDG